MDQSSLPVNIEDILNTRKIESDRIEFKEGWNPNTIYRSICAFANDFDNIGGGYILIGVKEVDGKAERPVQGLTDTELAIIQKEMIAFNNLVRPMYAPRLSIEDVDDKRILAIWIPGGPDRPYEVPESIKSKDKHFKYYIRRYANSIEAKGRDREDLIALASQQPFDDRSNRTASITDVNLGYVQEFLRVSGSKLLEQVGHIPPDQLLSHLNLLDGPTESRRVRNVALMLFSDAPERFFPYSYIDIVHFKGKTSGRSFTETRCSGPMQNQIRQALDYLRSTVIVEKVTKISGKAEARRAWNYPFDALEEAVVNAVYHRNYAESEPVSIRVEMDRIMIYNCGGPDRSIKLKDLQEGKVVAGRYRNRRLGDFLKEMDLTEGRSTGLSLIHEELSKNGSPALILETDEERTFFRLIFPIHPDFEGIVEESVPSESVIQSLARGLAKVLRADDLTDDLTGNLTGNQAGNQDGNQAGNQAVKMATILSCLSSETKGKDDLLAAIDISVQTKNVRRYIDPLEKAGLIEKTIPDKLTSPKQQYRLTEKGRKIIGE